jgi:Ca2+-transporting ATPase
MVLTDDNFASDRSRRRTRAHDRGRHPEIHAISARCNTGEIVFLLIAVLAGFPVPLIAIQILWINFVTDGLPALALGVERPEPDVLERKPLAPQQSLISHRDAFRILLHGLLVARNWPFSRLRMSF